MPALEELKDFDVEHSTVTLWVFKKSISQGKGLVFNGHWVGTTNPLDQAMKQAIIYERDRLNEVLEYGLLAQNNEASALTLTTLETHAGLFIEKAKDEIPAKKVSKIAQLNNTAFYVLKLVHNGRAIYAVRKTDDSWVAKKSNGKITACFSDHELDLLSDPGFNISKHIDFFVLDDDILVTNKPAFESILNYKQAHLEDFSALQVENEFTSVFSDTAHIVDFVGNNKIQLRRASAIRAKGHYKDPGFMQNLRQHCTAYGLQINFDPTGRIAPCADTCRDIFRALLDHRVTSPFSNMIYNVEDVAQVH